MLPNRWQLVDLRGPNAAVSFGTLERWQTETGVDMDTSVSGDAAWLKGIVRVLESLNLKAEVPTYVLLPNRILLYKVFRIPRSEQKNARELLSYEVTRGFPHDDADLLWSFLHLHGDEIENHFVVAAIRKSTLESLSVLFRERNIGFTAALPSLFCAFAHPDIGDVFHPDTGSSLHHLLSLEDEHGVSVSCGKSSGMVRMFSLKPQTNEPSSPSSAVNIGIELRSEIRKTMTSLKRQIGSGPCGSVTVVRRSEAAPLSLEVIKEWYDGDAQTVTREHLLTPASLLPSIRSMEPGTVLQLPVSVNSENAKTTLWKLLVLGVLIALSPYIWVWGNCGVIRSHKEHLLQAKAKVSERQKLAREYAVLRGKFESKMHTIDASHRVKDQQNSLLLLMNDLQAAQQAVGDTWFENMKLRLQDDETESQPILTMSGKFLVRQTNLQDSFRQQAIQDAEHSLQNLQEQIMRSVYVNHIREFKVNYGGIDQGINVVPFAMEVALDVPFSILNPAKEGHGAH